MKWITRCLQGALRMSKKKKYETKVYCKCFGLICWGMLPLFFMIASIGWSCPVANLINEFWAVRIVKLASSYKVQRHNFFSYSNSSVLDSKRTVVLLCPPPPLPRKMGLTNLIVNSFFIRNPNLGEQIADLLGIARKEYHGKSVEGRKCSEIPSCSAFLKELFPPSDHPLVECLEALLSSCGWRFRSNLRSRTRKY